MCVCVGGGGGWTEQRCGAWNVEKNEESVQLEQRVQARKDGNQSGDLDRGQYGEGLGRHSTHESCHLHDAFC